MNAFTWTTPGHRPTQEDHALAHPEKGVFIVADGFGGPVPGKAAAKTACEQIQGYLFKEAGDREATMPFVLKSYYSLAANVLFNALVHANRKLNRLNRGRGVHERGGASAIAAYMDGDLVAIANVGACGASLIREGRSVELVIPRSYARMKNPFGEVRPGHEQETEEQAEYLDAPMMALGICAELEPEIFEYKLKPGDWLVLHTDGIPARALRSLVEIQQLGLTLQGALVEVQSSLQAFGESPGYRDNASISLVIA